MAGDFNKPVVTDGYSSVLTYVRDLFADIAKGMDGTGTTNTPTGAIRWNSTNKYWEKYNGSWAALETKYMINVDQLDGYHANATATAGQIPVRDGSGKVDNVSLTGVSGTLGTGNGGTGLTSFTLGDITYCSATNTLSKLAGNITTTKQYLTQTGTGSTSAAPQWGALTDADIPGTLTNKTLSTGCSWSGNTLAVGSGGTGVTSYTTGDLLYASGASALSKLAAVAVGSVLASNGAGAAPVWTNAPTISGIVTHTAVSSSGKYSVHLSNSSPYISMWDTDSSRKWLMGSDSDNFRVYRATTQSETATDWVEKFAVDASGSVSIKNSAVVNGALYVSNSGNPNYSLIGDANFSSIYFDTNDSLTYSRPFNTLTHYVGGVQKFHIASDGSVYASGGYGVSGNGEHQLRLSVENDTYMYGNSTSMGFYQTTGSRSYLYCNNGGLYSPVTYGVTTGAGANVVVAGDGIFARSTSLRKYKIDVEPLAYSGVAFDKVSPVKYRSVCELDNGKTYYGFIAEEIAEVEPIAGVYDNEGKLENYSDRAMIAMLWSEVQSLRRRVTELEVR